MGFSRVGNSHEWFFAPEVPGLMNEPAGGFKQGPNHIKKQAQRFRVYGYDDKGRGARAWCDRWSALDSVRGQHQSGLVRLFKCDGRRRRCTRHSGSAA
ncbi:MAG: LodA/GoxA family CTQ-dependent oxidase [Bradyrhizobium sp.]